MTDPRVTGAVRYSQDVAMEGMIHARLLRSPVAHARVVGVDASAVPEGIIVLLPEDVRDLGGYGPQIKDQEVFPQERVRYAGDVVAAVAAETADEAEIAVGLIDVEYEELPAVFDEVESASGEAPLVHETINISKNDAAYFGIRPQQGRNICHRFRLRHGNVEVGFVEADAVVEEIYHTAGATHAPMEPHAAVARWDGDRLEVTTGTQTPFNMRTDLAGLFGIDEEKVRIISPPMGGSFGAKTFVRTEAIVACLARKAKRPVKIVLERDEMWMTLNRHPATVRVKLGARSDGTLVANETECWANTGAYADCGPGVAQKMGFAAPGPYRIANVRVDSRAVYTNLPPNGAFRGYGQMQSTWARERTMDLLADKLGMDPLELRMKNLLKDGDKYCTGETMYDVHFERLLQGAAEVEVDEETGRFRVMKLHAPIYAGRVINRPAAELQNEGSMIMGLGTALFESNEFAEGQITNANLSDYNVPAMDDMPATLSHELVEREGGEVQGLGETALPPVPPAIGNALYSGGIHVTELPISAERVLAAVDARDGRGPEEGFAQVIGTEEVG